MEWLKIEESIKNQVKTNTDKHSYELRKIISENIISKFKLERTYDNLYQVHEIITRYFIAYNIVSHKSLK